MFLILSGSNNKVPKAYKTCSRETTYFLMKIIMKREMSRALSIVLRIGWRGASKTNQTNFLIFTACICHKSAINLFKITKNQWCFRQKIKDYFEVHGKVKQNE